MALPNDNNGDTGSEVSSHSTPTQAPSPTSIPQPASTSVAPQITPAPSVPDPHLPKIYNWMRGKAHEDVIKQVEALEAQLAQEQEKVKKRQLADQILELMIEDLSQNQPAVKYHNPPENTKFEISGVEFEKEANGNLKATVPPNFNGIVVFPAPNERNILYAAGKEICELNGEALAKVLARVNKTAAPAQGEGFDTVDNRSVEVPDDGFSLTTNEGQEQGGTFVERASRGGFSVTGPTIACPSRASSRGSSGRTV